MVPPTPPRIGNRADTAVQCDNVSVICESPHWFPALVDSDNFEVVWLRYDAYHASTAAIACEPATHMAHSVPTDWLMDIGDRCLRTSECMNLTEHLVYIYGFRVMLNGVLTYAVMYTGGIAIPVKPRLVGKPLVLCLVCSLFPNADWHFA